MGTLRAVRWFDIQIAEAARRAVDAIDPAVLDLLRVGAYELRSDTRRPDPVIVDTIVSAARRAQPHAAGFVNAVMRRLAENEPPDPSLTDMGFDPWLVDRLESILGCDTEPFLEASQAPASTGIRTERTYSGAVEVSEIPKAWLWRWAAGPIPPGVRIQDPASVAVGLAVSASPGERILDLAAAPGGKASHLRDDVGEEGMVVAADIHRRRVQDARRRVPDVHWIQADGRVPPFERRSFDRVLVDAPCTGLGTLRRRPEIRYRVSPAEIDRLAAIQRRILEAALHLVRPGGRVVYAVCTVTPDETIGVVDGLGGRPPKDLPGRETGDGLLMGPHLGPYDGMFISVFDV
jgi:16S rRNA (cytosine967-C5)-methyltransferase